jgi:hypothetical protein
MCIMHGPRHPPSTSSSITSAWDTRHPAETCRVRTLEPVTRPLATPAIAAALRTPRSAALAGVVFALLYGGGVLILRLSLPGNVTDRGAWLADRVGSITTAVHLVAYAGIAFLWFMGVVRTRIGAREDRFISTVFTGSGYLFLAMTFTAGAVTSGLINVYQASGSMADGGSFTLGSRVAYELVNLYSVRMAAVFMISLATLCLRTGAMPRGFVWLTYALAGALLLSIAYTLWVTLVFPLWVLVFSGYLLVRGIGPQQESVL